MILIKSSSNERKIKSLIPANIKKLFVFIFANKFLGFLIKFLNVKTNLYGGYFDYKHVSSKEASLIFFGIWESAEIRFIKRFVKSDIIIELGSSVGVVIGLLAKINKNKKFICVEASKNNFLKLKHLKRQLVKLKNNNSFSLINKSIDYNHCKVHFFDFSSTGAKKIEKKDKNFKNSYLSYTITLKQILKFFGINKKYTLITDIEGAESEIFFKDVRSLKNCEMIISELEDTRKYSINNQLKQIKKIGFSLIEYYGNVYVFQKFNF